MKFTYHRPQGTPVDLVATIDSATTVGDLADHLRSSDPHGPGWSSEHRSTLTLTSQNNLSLNPDVLVADSPLTSGAHVSLGTAGTRFGEVAAATAAAVIRILNGPDVGKEIPLAQGSVIVGRDPQCEVVLNDTLVSRRHARINITDVAEVIDLGSANGVDVGTASVPRATLRPSDIVTIGETELSVRVVNRPVGDGTPASGGFNRAPRLAPVYVGLEHEAPEAPERPKPQRFPMIALLAPLLMGGVLYWVTRDARSLIFLALSPLMLIGTALESRLANRSDFKKAVAAFEADLEGLRGDMEAELVREGEVRRRELPRGAECLDVVRNLTPALWSWRPDAPDFLQLSLGLGALSSRSVVDYPKVSRAPHHLRNRAREVLEPLTRVPDVPVSVDLAAGPVGVAGPRSLTVGVARSLCLQLVALRSPSEFVLCAFLSGESAALWDWLKWLPHASSAHSPISGNHLTATNGDALALLAQLENLIEARGSDRDGAGSLPRVVVLAEADATSPEFARLVAVSEAGTPVGVHVVWLAAEAALLPSGCKTFATVDPAGGPGAVGFVTSGSAVVPVALDEVSADDAAAAARRLAPLHDVGALVADDSDLPRSVSQLGLLGHELADDLLAVIERWNENHSILTGPYAPETPARKPGNLRALVGQSTLGHHVLDLRRDGPHALVGGTTGSGKSELLQAWILALAAAHSPQRVNFLLVDYKGGAAFADCDPLPHSIGMVTDLSPHMVRRALTSLGAELKYREELLREHDAKDLQALEAQGFVGAPPSLVVVVDEFAALREEVPEFVDGMVDIAQRGRSLGIHLIMATQRPAGVITGSLRANTNLRLALRLADEADSTDILGTADAAAFDPDTPGRAVSKSGPGRLVPFQSCYVGGWTTPEGDAPEILVQELTLLTAAVWQQPVGEPVTRDKDATDIKRVVRQIRDANRAAGLPEPRKVWQPALPATQSLARVHRSATDTELAFAVADDPQRQAQPTIAFHPDRDGNMVAYGTGGAGKSTFLRSMAVAAGLTMKSGPCHVYGLDFGSRGLAMLEQLPHVGSIIPGGDHERVTRLLAWVRAEIDERAARYSAVNAGTLTQYRKESGNADEPRLVLLVDGMAAFQAAYDASDRSRWIDVLTSIASEGRPVGVHLILTSETRFGLPPSMAAAVQRRLVLRQATEDEYGMLSVPADVLTPTSPPGRGIVDDLEVQVAVFGGSADPVLQAAELASLAKAMREAGTSVAPPVQSLPDRIHLGSLPTTPGLVTFGVAGDTLTPLGVPAKGSFLLSGAVQSGRSTALRTLVEAFDRAHPDGERHYLGLRHSVVSALPGWASTTSGTMEIERRAQELADRIGAGGARRIAVFLESAGDHVNSPAELALQQLVKACNAEEQWFVVEGELSTLAGPAGFLGAVKASRHGLALQPDPDSGHALFKVPFGRIHRHEFPPGRGLYVVGGRARVVQVAQPG
nr:FtsK/SpoIIIE domain-containing protein [Nocardioides kongjuensis]